MQNDNALPRGFVPVEEAIALIKADRRDDAKVDLQFMVNNIPFIQKGHNFNVRTLKTTEDGKVVRTGEVWVNLATEYDAQILLRALRDAYQERTNIALNTDQPGVNRITTAIDEEAQSMDGRPKVNTASTTKVGADISRPYEQTLQGV